MRKMLRKQNGVTLIELVIALVISTFLTAAIYRTFVGQQKTYITQEQVVDVQQNIRFTMGNIMKEIRMIGFGNFTLPKIVNAGADTLTFRLAADAGSTLTAEGGIGQTQIVVSSLTGFVVNAVISIGGVESNVISAINMGTKTVTLTFGLGYKHVVGTPLYLVSMIAYRVAVVNGISVLQRDDGGGFQTIADGIEALSFAYFDQNGAVTATPADIRRIQVSLTAKTNRQDPDYKEGGGYRRRQIVSNIHLRNMGI
jgi:prepilin-type N-terminal cleavage/methylation domain-containing protein